VRGGAGGRDRALRSPAFGGLLYAPGAAPPARAG
jgi:hypothetical protein